MFSMSTMACSRTTEVCDFGGFCNLLVDGSFRSVDLVWNVRQSHQFSETCTDIRQFLCPRDTALRRWFCRIRVASVHQNEQGKNRYELQPTLERWQDWRWLQLCAFR